MTASFLATATRAFFKPTFLAGVRPQAFSGPTILSKTELMTDANIACWNIVDEAIRIDCKLNLTAVIDVLWDLFIQRGVPGHMRSDNGPEFIAKAVQDWIAAVGAKTAYIEPGSPWEERHSAI